MKTTITRVLVRNAIEAVHRARLAHSKRRLDEEIRHSISAHLFIALTIESIGNEVGEVVFDKSKWDQFEKCNTLKKWCILSKVAGHPPFEMGKEPLQTVQRLMSIRNRIVHPKPVDIGDEIIVQSKNGNVKRNVRSDYVLNHGDFIMMGAGNFLEEFNCNSSMEAVKKSVVAIKKLRERLAISGIDWLDDMDKLLTKYK